MEIKRLLNKRVMLAGILICLFQVAAFLLVQLHGKGLSELWRYSKSYNNLVNELDTMSLENASYRLEGYENDEVVASLKDKLSYLIAYPDTICQILDNAESVKAFSIFRIREAFHMKIL